MEVWSLVEQSWVDDVAENGKWPAAYVHDNYSAWGDDTAAPRGKDSAISWSRFADENGNTLKYELAPEAIAVANDTAVVHYNVSMVTENHEGKRSSSVGRITEVLIRDGRGWKWLGGVSYEPKLNK
ncbi:MAG: SnoaL-like domain-containing protein [Woeseia sp.]|nr:SnoaL-like domain-containing protein [Woeseia sp.]NNL54600.1 SnoaL-like domain-containing protein [Woeseia sp.]